MTDGEKYDAMYGLWVEFYFIFAEYKGSSGCWFRGGKVVVGRWWEDGKKRRIENLSMILLG